MRRTEQLWLSAQEGGEKGAGRPLRPREATAANLGPSARRLRSGLLQASGACVSPLQFQARSALDCECAI